MRVHKKGHLDLLASNLQTGLKTSENLRLRQPSRRTTIETQTRHQAIDQRAERHQRNGTHSTKATPRTTLPKEPTEENIGLPGMMTEAEVAALMAAPLPPPPLNTVPTVHGPAAKPTPFLPPKPATTPAPGRTAQGTFSTGNQFGCGNPNNRKMAALRTALVESLTADKMKQLGQKLFDVALGGDWVAAKLLLAYGVGKPPETVDSDKMDLQEVQILMESPDFHEWAERWANSDAARRCDAAESPWRPAS